MKSAVETTWRGCDLPASRMRAAAEHKNRRPRALPYTGSVWTGGRLAQYLPRHGRILKPPERLLDVATVRFGASGTMAAPKHRFSWCTRDWNSRPPPKTLFHSRKYSLLYTTFNFYILFDYNARLYHQYCYPAPAQVATAAHGECTVWAAMERRTPNKDSLPSP